LNNLLNSTVFLTDSDGKKIAAVIGIAAYEQILEELDDKICVDEYDKAKIGNLEFSDFSLALEEILAERNVSSL
jgi:hypothetical protein